MNAPIEMYPVLDKGYVELLELMPAEVPHGADSRDIAIVNAARTSYMGDSKGTEADRKLLHYLWRNGHTTPFEMVEFKFRVKAPAMVWWQWTRHRTWNYNLQSGRYTETADDEFYIPTEWRLQSEDNKQASYGSHIWSNSVSNKLSSHISDSMRLYEGAIENGIAREQARLFLPAWAIYYTGIAKVDLKNLLHFLKLRNHPHAQWEIRQYAIAIEKFVETYFPWTYEIFKGIE